MSKRLSQFADTVEVRVQGIPCLAHITHFLDQKPLGPSADSDLDCYGYTEVEYDLYDLEGYRAQWLERKATDKDHERIVEAILNA